MMVKTRTTRIPELTEYIRYKCYPLFVDSRGFSLNLWSYSIYLGSYLKFSSKYLSIKMIKLLVATLNKFQFKFIFLKLCSNIIQMLSNVFYTMVYCNCTLFNFSMKILM